MQIVRERDGGTRVKKKGERERDMAEGRLRRGCSYKKTTWVVCSINIVIALYVLRSLYSSLYIYSGNVSRNSKSLFFVLNPIPPFELVYMDFGIPTWVFWGFFENPSFKICFCSMLVIQGWLFFWLEISVPIEFGDFVRNLLETQFQFSLCSMLV